MCNKGCSPLLALELSPFNVLYRGTLVRSITLVPFEMLMIFGIHVYRVKTETVCHMQEWLLPFVVLLNYLP